MLKDSPHEMLPGIVEVDRSQVGNGDTSGPRLFQQTDGHYEIIRDMTKTISVPAKNLCLDVNLQKDKASKDYDKKTLTIDFGCNEEVGSFGRVRRISEN